jgi:tRNA pseudouridine55 synthase
MFLFIDKPKGLTSHDVVDRVRKITGERRVGHAGTLDPNASGLLIVGVGRESTRELDQYLKQDKTYIAQITLGEERDTDDIEGEVTLKDKNGVHPSKEEILKILKSFVGSQKQIPPQYSAIKVAGKEAYKTARKGGEVLLKPRNVVIKSLTLNKYSYPVLEVICEVGSGTYIRSLARDMGRKLGTFAYLSNLRRTKIGKYDISQATFLDQIKDIIKL